MIIFIESMFKYQSFTCPNAFFSANSMHIYKKFLNEGVKLPTPNKRGNEIEEDVSTRKKVKNYRW